MRRAQARTARRANWWPLALGLLTATLLACSALAQTAVVKPPAHVDPGMQVKPKHDAVRPMPVVRPPVRRGDTVVVPK